jgi:tetratricopeptide (TPR) repeat protein
MGFRLGIVVLLGLSAVLPAHAQDGDLDRAWRALEQGDSDQATRFASAALRDSSLEVADVAAAYNLRGMAAMRRDDFGGARADFALAAALAPRFAAAHTNKGLASAKLEDYAAAIEAFSRALDLVPGAPEVLFMRGNAHFDKGEFAAAAEDYGKAAAGNPKHWAALANRCDALGRLGRMDEAKAECGKARAVAPDPGAVDRIEQALGQPCDCAPR